MSLYAFAKAERLQNVSLHQLIGVRLGHNVNLEESRVLMPGRSTARFLLQTKFPLIKPSLSSITYSVSSNFKKGSTV